MKTEEILALSDQYKCLILINCSFNKISILDFSYRFSLSGKKWQEYPWPTKSLFISLN